MFVFVCPYLGPGGVETFIIRFIRKLNENGETAKIISVPDSFVCRELNKTNNSYILIDIELLESGSLSEWINPDDIFVCKDIALTYISKLRIINPRILFYSVLPNTFVKKSLNILGYKNKLKKFLDYLNQKGGLYFMDYENYITPCEHLKYRIDPVRYIPIPVNTFAQNLFNRNSRIFEITYIGRGTDTWKVYPVKKILEDLSQTSFEGEFHIITDRIENFENILSKISLKTGILIRYHLGLSGKALDEYLLQHSDLHISMGTSALEGAKLGIPTLLIDYSYHEFPANYTYRWIYYKNSPYSLGRWIEKQGLIKGFSIEEILEIIKDSEKKLEISEKCFSYVNKNHSVENFYSYFKKAECLCLLHVNDLYSFLFIRLFFMYIKFPGITRFLFFYQKKIINI